MNIIPFVAGYFLVVGIYLVLRDRRVSQWPDVEGQMVNCHIGSANKSVENFRVSDFVYEHIISAHLEYRYHVGGEKYIGNRLSFSLIYGSRAVLPLIKKQLQNIGVTPEGNIKIFYEPSNPKKSVLLKPGLGSKSMSWVCVLVGLLFFLAEPVVV